MCVGCYTTQILTVMEVKKSTVKKPCTDIWHQKCLSSLSNQLKMLVFSKIQQNNFEIFQTRNGPCLMTGSECRSIYLDFLLCLDTCFLWSFKMSYPIFFLLFLNIILRLAWTVQLALPAAGDNGTKEEGGWFYIVFFSCFGGGSISIVQDFAGGPTVV